MNIDAEISAFATQMKMERAEALRYVTEDEKVALEAAIADIMSWRDRHPLAASLWKEMRYEREGDDDLLSSFSLNLEPLSLGRHRRYAEYQQRKQAEREMKEQRKAARLARQRGEDVPQVKPTRASFLNLVK